MESGQRALIEGSGRRTQKFGPAFGPEQRNPADPRRAEHRKIRAVKAQDRDDGYVRPSHPGVLKRAQGDADGRRLARDRVQELGSVAPVDHELLGHRRNRPPLRRILTLAFL